MPKPNRSLEVVHVRGRIAARNISPKGHVEGLLVETARGIVQVNLPKHADPSLAASFPPGAAVDLRTEIDDAHGAHPVHRLLESETATTGTVARLNYALHGEVNGFHLDDGTFVHLKPEGAAKHELHVGDEVAVNGARKVGPDATVLEAREVKRLGPKKERRARDAAANGA